jgi:electron transfer flavoprotein beta subunit
MGLNIIVCIKQVPDVSQLSIDPEKGVLRREDAPNIINPGDKHALECALQLRELHSDSTITALCMGTAEADDALREALAMGADRAILLSDDAFGGADTFATAIALGSAINKIAKFDLVLCGTRTDDGGTGHVGPQLAEYLGLPQISYVRKIEIINANKIKVERVLAEGYEVLEAPLPVLLTVHREMNKPRYPPIRGIVEAYREREVTLWSLEDIGARPGEVGFSGSPMRVLTTKVRELRRRGKKIEAPPEDAVRELLKTIAEEYLV